MWILLALIMMVVALKAFSFSFTLALIPFAIGVWCFSKSNRESLDNFMAFAFFIVLIGFIVNVIISIW
jgi:undecaprenyl pyrophosphate phosphatase UppP